ncbi:hypothetical protein NPL1_01910 [Metamycoplasma hyosynoviae]|uniref:Mbov_0401 family ICE element transposase-like protein n=1 Tax=Metamycoplasma hyosynoviae TaxID=29559 RepID=UPI00046207C4|nr:UPF0236 family protein [Metamycoplasma hyosynoviae]KDE43055.1 hypothetical protein NPL1_01910 [Metamycoplasma hyosynoviae]MDD1366451.1 hypothetical protein [Metamycoplasma hyosynoviae]
MGNQIQNITQFFIDSIYMRDNEFFNSEKRRQENWKVKDFITRKIVLPTDVVYIQTRRYYRIANGNIEYYNVLQSLFNLKFKNIIDDTKTVIKQDVLSGVSYRMIAKKYGISKSMAQSIFAENFENIKYRDNFCSYKSCTEGKNIYIAADDTFFKIKGIKNIHKKIKARMFNFFTLNDNKKPENKNHLVFLIEDNKMCKKDKFVLEISNILKNFYGNYDNIIFTGDGADWIKQLAKTFNASYILCKYHLHSRYNAIFNNSKGTKKAINQIKQTIGIDLKQLISKSLREEDYLFIIDFTTNNWNAISPFFGENKQKLLWEFIYYIKNNLKGLEISKNDPMYYGNVCESYVSHLVKAQVKRPFSVWNINQVVQKIVNPLKNNNNVSVEIIR